jgi:hypothetical protein
MAKIRKFAAFLLVLVFSACTATDTYAQSYYEPLQRTFYGGLVAGTNFSQVDGDNFAGYHKVGANVGGIVYAQFTELIAGSVEILFSQKGARATKTPQLSNTKKFVIQEYSIDLNYAEIPVMINYFDKKNFHVGAGVSYSQLISSDEKLVSDQSAINAIDLNKEYPFKKYDIQFLLGGSIHIYKGFFLGVRFQYSMVPVRTEIHEELGRPEQFNNVYAFRLMYLFGVNEPKY